MNQALVTFNLSAEAEFAEIVLDGDLTHQRWEDMLTTFQKQANGGILHWRIDLSRLRFLETTGMGVLIAMMASLRKRNGTLRVRVEEHSQPAQLFSVGKLDKLIPLEFVPCQLDRLPQGFVPLSLVGGLIAGPDAPAVTTPPGV